MPRKSKAKYKMKGHSIPGVKGFKTTTLEDGRAASSAFQMQSPLHVEGDAYELDDINIKSSDSDANRATAQRAGQTGANYGMEQLIKLGGRLRDKKAAEKMEDQTTKYEVTGDAEDNSNAEFQSLASDQFETDEKANIKDDINESLSDQVVMSTPTAPKANTMDYSGASKNEMTNMRREIKDSGEDFDPKNNPEHAEIQNKINELYGSPKRY
tara:strand:+ start:428 stop:1063 length:636 start_codon:yes stop_codon:yes gene_type:complete